MSHLNHLGGEQPNLRDFINHEHEQLTSVLGWSSKYRGTFFWKQKPYFIELPFRAPKDMKNKVLGHQQPRLFTIKTSKHVNFWGPWSMLNHQTPSFRKADKKVGEVKLLTKRPTLWRERKPSKNDLNISGIEIGSALVSLVSVIHPGIDVKSLLFRVVVFKWEAHSSSPFAGPFEWARTKALSPWMWALVRRDSDQDGPGSCKRPKNVQKTANNKKTYKIHSKIIQHQQQRQQQEHYQQQHYHHQQHQQQPQPRIHSKTTAESYKINHQQHHCYKINNKIIQNQQQPPTKKKQLPTNNIIPTPKQNTTMSFPLPPHKKHKKRRMGHPPSVLTLGHLSLNQTSVLAVVDVHRREACSRTLDFAFADAACSAVATLLRKSHEASELKERSRKAGLRGGGERWGFGRRRRCFFFLQGCVFFLEGGGCDDGNY